MKQITAVEWLNEMLRDNHKEVFDGNIWEQAKAMEKDITDNKVIHFAEWLTNKHTTTLISLYEHFEEQYYNETFKSE